MVGEKRMAERRTERRRRVERARELLAAGENVTETARAAGYDDPLEFSRFFKKHTGLSPSAYAAQERRGQ